MKNTILFSRIQQVSHHMLLRKSYLQFHVFAAIILITILTGSIAFSYDSTIVDKYGSLRVVGNKIVDKNGSPVVLRGMSLYWSQWKGQFYNYDCIKWLRDDWKCTVVRASMGVGSGGYLTNPAIEKAKVITVIDACIDLGIYVIVDWHDHTAEVNRAQAISFFQEIANQYNGIPNLVYEIYNEPQTGAGSWNSSIKPYSDSVVKYIRAIEPDNIIVVGTPNWSQYVDEAANNPLSYSNIAYSLHFYAYTHRQWLRDRATTALNKGIALFVTEFGTCESSGSGILEYTETDTWLKFLDANKISWCNWSLADLGETSAALNPGASPNGGWTTSDFKPSGSLVRGYIIAGNIPTGITPSLELPLNFELQQNYPNPFNPSTNILYSLKNSGKVCLSVYDLLGRKVAVLVNGVQNAGEHTATFSGVHLTSGIYFYRLTAAGSTDVKKMMLIK
jgi:endoglucanase